MRRFEPEVAAVLAGNRTRPHVDKVYGVGVAEQVYRNLDALSVSFRQYEQALLARRMAEQETLVRRMLAHWVSELDLAPVLYFDHRNEIIGIGPDSAIGEKARIFIRAADHLP